ncbi:MAG: DUF3306 domain-containing protein [Hydrogenophaga sp.]|nr:DUF3306 domain-containing protein [Hydrogenophaga sp.]
MSKDNNFFSRWSRRKVLAQTGEPLPEPVPVSTPVVAAAEAVVSVPTPAAEAAVPEPAVSEPAQPPLPTLDDVARLTPQSDFKPFVARAVDPQVRNAAMKTLFSDPHFNVMDGLDIYIDDYSKPDPLPLELARKLTSAQFMKVFDAPEQAPEQVPPQAPANPPEPAVAEDLSPPTEPTEPNEPTA